MAWSAQEPQDPEEPLEPEEQQGVVTTQLQGQKLVTGQQEPEVLQGLVRRPGTPRALE